ncbi:MAG: hypothetical protein AB7G80_05040 [Dongiaceae bacterium]
MSIFKPARLLDLISGLGGMFGKPAIAENPVNAAPPSPQAGTFVLMPSDRSPQEWDNWEKIWNIQRNPTLLDMPNYPFGGQDQTTGDSIRRSWHDMNKDFAAKTVQSNFPDFTVPKPKADQSFHQYMADMAHQALGINSAMAAESSSEEALPKEKPSSDLPGNIRPSPQETTLKDAADVAGALSGKIINPIVGKIVDKAGSMATDKITEREYNNRIKTLEDLIAVSSEKGNVHETEIWRKIKILNEQDRAAKSRNEPIPPMGRKIRGDSINELLKQLKDARKKDEKNKTP